MRLNFYQVAIVIFLAGLFGYFVWPTLYTYEDINVRSPSTSLSGTRYFSYEQLRIRVHRINGLADKDLGLNRWEPYVRVRKCNNDWLAKPEDPDGQTQCEQ